MPAPVGRRAKLFSLLVFVGSLALSLAIVFAPIDPRQLAAWGYAGIFVITLLGALSLFIPGPTMVAAYLLGATLNPLWVTLAAGLGSALGESTGYAVGRASRELIAARDSGDTWYWRILRSLQAHPFATIFVLSAVPNFLTDLGGLTAGRMQYAYGKFLFATFLGKCVRFGLSAYLGAYFGVGPLRR